MSNEFPKVCATMIQRLRAAFRAGEQADLRPASACFFLEDREELDRLLMVEAPTLRSDRAPIFLKVCRKHGVRAVLLVEVMEDKVKVSFAGQGVPAATWEMDILQGGMRSYLGPERKESRSELGFLFDNTLLN
jgi:hypothetical protein